MTTTNICSAFLATVARRGDATALRSKTNGEWNEISWNQLAAKVARFAGGLRKAGVMPGDRVAIMIPNKPEFYVADLAVLFVGATPISLYQTSSAEQVVDLCARSEAKLLIDEAAFADIDGDPVDLAAEAALTRSTDLATVIFTSGTTSAPKGVMITHENVSSMVAGVRTATDTSFEGLRVVSYLPLAHIAERALSYYLPVYEGMEVTTCPDPTSLAAYLQNTRPHLFFGVPRVWERMFSVAQRNLADKPLLAKTVKALIVGGPVTQKLGEPVFKKIRAKLGLDEVLFAASGAAPLSRETGEWFSAIGIPFSEIYGLSETTAPMTWSPKGHKLGTVGKPMPGAEVRLLPDGEIAVRGGNVFAGYLNDADATAAAMHDGWFCTGDIGEFDSRGNLKIVDRKKDLIITEGGKNISPAALESRLSVLPEIGFVSVIGDRRPFLTAVITLDADTVDSPEVRKAIADHIAAVNAVVSQPERIKKHVVVTDAWAPDSDVLTATLKVKRRGVELRYANEIDALYVRKSDLTAA